jgi:hypothetical protein
MHCTSGPPPLGYGSGHINHNENKTGENRDIEMIIELFMASWELRKYNTDLKILTILEEDIHKHRPNEILLQQQKR